MLKLFFIQIILLLIFAGNTYAGNYQNSFQDTSTVVEEEEYEDTETIISSEPGKNKFDETDTVLYFNNLPLNPDSITALKNEKAFAYVKTLDSLLKAQQEKQKTKEPVRNNFFERLFSSGIFKIILWAIVISFVLFLLYRLFLADGVFKKSSTKSKTPEPEVKEENLSGNSDFDLFIKKALSDNNYRLAIRYHYLKSLHKLSDNGLLTISPNKTNYQYVREIKNYQYQNHFSALTLNYEYVWYGEFNIDETIYKKIESDFNKFNKNFR